MSERDDIADVLALHRWRSMGLNSVQCECGEVITDPDVPTLNRFPADELFRLHLADKILEALR